ncbi:MAG: hypothetical protein KAW88_02065 [Candidatus Cloacimonetes bacterium]|nr:hypothetical protein [Candidatus Cloacimonadota bacterium]
MKKILKVVELDGFIDKNHKLLINDSLSEIPSCKVHILLMLENDKEIDEKEWLSAASKNSVFDFLKDPQEDIYTITDGKPFND